MSALDTVLQQGIRHTALGEELGDQAEAELAALRAVAEAARARCRDAVPEWAPELRAALRAWEEQRRG